MRLLLLLMLMGVIACGGGEEKPALTEREESPAVESEENEEREEKVVLTGVIKINEVTADELASYKIGGLGAKTAEKIIAYRETNGPFKNYEDLDKAPGVGPAMLTKLEENGIDFGEFAAEGDAPVEGGEEKAAPKTTASSGGTVNVNTADAEELDTLPGVGPALAEKIIAYREEKGKFKSMDDLDKVPGVGPAMLEKLEGKVSF